jgi:hypothetical protein
MNLSKFFVLTFIIIIPSWAFGQDWKIHSVKKNECLITILQQFDVGPLFGKEGAIARTISLNPDLLKSKGSRLYPRQNILLPMKELISQPQPIVEEVKMTSLESQERNPGQEVSDEAGATLNVSAGFDYFKIQGVEKSTKDQYIILSDASPTLALGFNVLWDQVTTISLNTKIQRYKLQPLGNGNFNSDSGNKVDLSFRAMRKFSQRWSLGAGIAFEQDLFFHTDSASRLNVDKVMVVKPELYFRYVALSKINSNLGFDAKAGINLPGETNLYRIKSGTHAGFGTFINYHSMPFDKNYKSIEAKVFYSIDNQDTSVATRKFTNLSFIISYEWGLPW